MYTHTHTQHVITGVGCFQVCLRRKTQLQFAAWQCVPQRFGKERSSRSTQQILFFFIRFWNVISSAFCCDGVLFFFQNIGKPPLSYQQLLLSAEKQIIVVDVCPYGRKISVCQHFWCTINVLPEQKAQKTRYWYFQCMTARCKLKL